MIYAYIVIAFITKETLYVTKSVDPWKILIHKFSRFAFEIYLGRLGWLIFLYLGDCVLWLQSSVAHAVNHWFAGPGFYW